jgi:hypothetical protein
MRRTGLVVELLKPGSCPPRADRVARVAVSTAGSLAALKAWLVGDARYRVHRYADAVGAFEEAERLDPDFALAYYRHATRRTCSGTRPRPIRPRCARCGTRIGFRNRSARCCWPGETRGPAR